jgi:hypothetical protein
MATLQEQLAAIQEAKASGVTEVRYADGSGAKYRSLDEMDRIEARLLAQISPPAANINPRLVLAGFTRG